MVALRRIVGSVDAAVAEVLDRHGLTPLQYAVLRVLRGTGAEGLPAGEVGVRMGARAPDATRLVDRLEKQGRVRRERRPGDRRVVQVRITEAGRRTLAELDLPITALHRRQFGHLGTTRLADLVTLLEALPPVK